MLVLSRRIGEKIVIGDGIVVTIVEVHRDSVRLGVDAPRSVPVNRAELLEAVSEENVAAMSDTEAAAALSSLQGMRPRSAKIDLKQLLAKTARAGGSSAPGGFSESGSSAPSSSAPSSSAPTPATPATPAVPATPADAAKLTKPAPKPSDLQK